MKHITLNERAAAVAMKTVFGEAGKAMFAAVYTALDAAERTGADEGYNEGFEAALRVVQPMAAEEEFVYSFSTTAEPLSEAEVAAAEEVLYGK